MSFTKGQFVTFNWGDLGLHVGCIIGKTGKKKYPWKVGVMPKTKDDGGLICTVEIQTDKLMDYTP